MRTLITVTMSAHDWARVLTAVGSANAFFAKNKRPKDADEMELVGRQIARSCRHQARAKREKSE